MRDRIERLFISTGTSTERARFNDLSRTSGAPCPIARSDYRSQSEAENVYESNSGGPHIDVSARTIFSMSRTKRGALCPPFYFTAGYSISRYSFEHDQLHGCSDLSGWMRIFVNSIAISRNTRVVPQHLVESQRPSSRFGRTVERGALSCGGSVPEESGNVDEI